MFSVENMNKFRKITETIENVQQKQPPENFTTDVMARLSEEKETVQAFSFHRLFSTNLSFGFQQSVTKTECAFYFLLTGFFYFILGLIMMAGLPLPAIMHDNLWISFQPFFGLLLAVELLAIGTVLYKKGDSAIRFVRMGTLLYAALIILDCWIATFYIRGAAELFFIVVFSMTGLVLAVLLGLAIDRYYPGTAFSEVRG